MNDRLEELTKIVGTWNHERDRAVYRYPDGREQLLYDSGCKCCRRCQMELWIAKQLKGENNER